MTKELKTKLFTKLENGLLLGIKQSIKKSLYVNLKYIKEDSPYIVVAGGCFASLLNDPSNRVNDIDVFIQHDTHPAIELLRKDTRFTELGKQYKDNDSNIVAVFSDKHSELQYIFTKHKTRQDVIREFDFVHCMISYDSCPSHEKTDKLYLTREMFDAATKKILIPNKPKDKIKESRWKKFKDRGYNEVVSI
jgi:hypothetical protein